MRNLLLLLIILLLQQSLNAQEIATFTLQHDDININSPVAVPLPSSDKNNLNDKQIALYEIKDNKEIYVASQLEWNTKPLLWFIPSKQPDSGSQRNYIIKLTDTSLVNSRLDNNN